MNQVPMAKTVYAQLRKATDTVYDDVEFVIIDNGSSEPLSLLDFPGAKIIRNEKSTGVYPTFKQGFENTEGEFVAFFHSDLIVWEERWNERVVRAFEENGNLGMIGFIGSNEIDSAGGRGLGTTSNFQGKSLSGDPGMDGLFITWHGSAAAVHGKVSEGLSFAAVIDGCAMIIKRSAYVGEDMYRDNFPPHHFYDRLISTQMLEKKFDVAVLGIECDHISGQTVNQEPAYQQMAYEWLKRRSALIDGLIGDFDPAVNYDADIYQIAEAMWLDEYRRKGLVPCRV